MRGTSSLLWLSLGSLLVLWPCRAIAGHEDDEDFRPGLVAEYRTEHRALTRIDPDVAFAWDDAAPDGRLERGPFEVTWRGLLLIRSDVPIRFHAVAQGEVSIEFDGRRVLHGSVKEAAWVSSEPFTPALAERPIVVTFRKTEPTAQIKLFWSSDSFGLEPLPPELLFHDASQSSVPPDAAAKESASDLNLIELGRQQFEMYRCGSCHRREGEAPPPMAPALKHFAESGYFHDRLSEHFGSAVIDASQTFPRFTLFDPNYDALQAFLLDQSQPVEFDKPKSIKESDLAAERRKGELLLRSTGCLACHRIGELGGQSSAPFPGPDLSNVGQQRTLPWLVTWLAKPERLNADHRMPVFNLSDAERNQLALALWTLQADPDAKPTHRLTQEQLTAFWKNWSDLKANKDPQSQAQYRKIVERGRQAIVERRCAACHRFADDNAVRFEKPAADLSRPVADWSNSCLAKPDGSQNVRPSFGEKLNRESLKAFLASRWNVKLSPSSQFSRGQRVLEQKGCLACHSRHGVGGFGKMAAQVASFDNDLNGLAPSLVPPSLNAVGDKLLDDALNIAVRGERQPIRMPWLKVRMPKFAHTPEEQALLTRYFVEHDRIPPLAAAAGTASGKGDEEKRRRGEKGNPPVSSAPRPSVATVREKDLQTDTHLAGQALMGPRGWSCIACHKVGDYEPKQVALGARGSDLKMLGKHLRPEFFFRWIASPLRVIPGVEMPQFNRPVVGVLDGNLSKQHAALWQALNDPNFQPPTNPANVEQLWVVNPGEQPRVVRDVFQLPKDLGGGTVARSFAIGFSNGHSLLFDLGSGSLRQWTFGDFARQQTVGKRWFWEMAGVNVLRQLKPTPFQLRSRGATDNKSAIRPDSVTLMFYESTEQSVKLFYGMSFPNSDPTANPLTITVWDQFQPLAESNDGVVQTGIERELQLIWPSQKLAEEFEVLIDEPTDEQALGQAKVSHDPPRLERETLSPKYALEHVKMRYTTSLERSPLALPAKPMVKLPKTSLSSVPGFDGVQLPLDASLMPTGFAWQDGVMAMTSLKGQVLTLADEDGDGIEDRLTLVEEGLTAPYGLTGSGGGKLPLTWLVAHKPELLSLRDRDGDGRADQRMVTLSGWGFTDDYHEWTTSPVFEPSRRQLFWGLASDYTDKNRSAANGKWRGKVLMATLHFGTQITPVGHAFRYPTGIAINESDEVFVSDQQGVQNCFNEINYLVEGASYGVPSSHEEKKDAPETKAAIQIPHPWTRSVNGLCFLTGNEGYPDLKGHGIGCEYNGRFLIRFTTQRVGDVMQGAVYPFSLTDDELVRRSAFRRSEGEKDAAGKNNEQPPKGETTNPIPLGATNAIEVSGGKPAAPRQQTIPNFEGPLCCGVNPKGELYIGSISDSGWAGGQNTGSIVKLKGNGQRPNGIREIRATHDGFDIDFFAPVDRDRATNPEHYTISGYTRVWGGAYATPDSDRHRCKVRSMEVSADKKTAHLKVEGRKSPNYVYEISCRDVAEPNKPLWPDYGFFTLHRIPNE